MGSTVRLVEGVVILGTAVADSAGNWSITSTTLADGVHNIAARAVDMAGNIGPASAALVVTIDTVHPLLAFLSPSVPGDTNGDDNCDLQDLANVLNNLGKSSIGDVNGDGFVDAQDREIVANHLGERVPRGGAQTASAQARSAPSIAAFVIAESSTNILVTPIAGAESIPIGPANRARLSMPAKLGQPAEVSALLIANAHATRSMESTPLLHTDPSPGVQLSDDNAPAIDIFFEQLPSKSVDPNQQYWPSAACELAGDKPDAENSLEVLTDAVIKDPLDWEADLLSV